MAVPTHVIDNGLFERWMSPNEGRLHFLAGLRAMDGENFYMQVMFRLIRPAWSEDLTQDELDRSREYFIQAGGSAESMTVEVRAEIDGNACLYTVGRLAADSPQKNGDPDVRIRRGVDASEIYSDEEFSADEAADIFFHYYRFDSVPEDYFLRETVW